MLPCTAVGVVEEVQAWIEEVQSKEAAYHAQAATIVENPIVEGSDDFDPDAATKKL